MYGVGEPVQGGRTMTVEIGGRDRFKFFKRPMVPTLEGGTQTNQAPLALASNRPTIQRALQPRSQALHTDARGGSAPAGIGRPSPLDPVPKRQKPKQAFLGSSGLINSSGGGVGTTAHGAVSSETAGQVSADGGTREMSCQTMYRENDCQTDPYTPDYFVEEGKEPEVLALVELRYGEGLPAGLGEVEMIDRVQRRRNVESSLPQGGDKHSMQARLEALEKLEKTEWEEREAHIHGLQEGRLEQIDAALHRREARREEASRQRVESLKQKRLEEVETQLQRLQERRMATTRKLTVKHSNPCASKERRDIIGSHAINGTKGKSVTTNALVEKINTANYDVRPTLLTFGEGLEELERTKVPKLETVKEAALAPPKDKAMSQLGTNFQKRQAQRVRTDLEYADSIIQASKQEKQEKQSVQDLYRATPRLERPDTPTLVLAGDAEEEREEAVLLLQRLLRGRAVQNDFFEGKERCHGLIEELQAASNAKGHEEWWRTDKEREELEARQGLAVQRVVDEAQGALVFATLDFLRKELLRQQEAAKVDRLRALALATRADREKAERQRREAEREARSREEYQYAAIVRSTDATVETYLDQLLQSTVRTSASTQAVQEQLAPKPTPRLETELDEEDYVCGLLDNYVIPVVCERVDRGTKEMERRKALAEVAVAGAAAASAAKGVR